MLERGSILPIKAHDNDGGFDIFTPLPVIVLPHESAIINTGVHMQIPKGYVGFLKSKSGLNVKHDITGEGVIDADYTGSIVVKLYNHGDDGMIFERGDKLIQIVLLPIPDVNLVEVAFLDDTPRGANGFGSTGR